MSSLKKNIASNYVGTVLRFLLSFLSSVILTRIIEPEQFGLMASVSIILTLGFLIADSGFGTALVHEKNLTTDAICFAFTIQFIAGILITIVIFLTSPLLAKFYGHSELTVMFRFASIVIVVQSLGQTALSLLKKNMRFSEIQFIQTISYIIGFYIFAIPLAKLGYGIWSLLIANMIQVFSSNIMYYLKTRHYVRVTFRINRFELFSYSKQVYIANILNWIINSCDTVLIGRFFPQSYLGAYNRMYQITFLPVGTVTSSIQSAAFSHFSASSSSNNRDIIFLLISGMSLVAFPFAFSSAALSYPLVFIIYGEKFIPYAFIFSFLSFGASAFAVMSICGSYLWGSGVTKFEPIVSASISLLMILLLLLSVKFDFWVCLLAVVLVNFLRMFIMVYGVAKKAGDAILIFAEVLKGILLGSICYIAISFISFHFNLNHINTVGFSLILFIFPVVLIVVSARCRLFYASKELIQIFSIARYKFEKRRRA